jgi:hypothetical protein
MPNFVTNNSEEVLFWNVNYKFPKIYCSDTEINHIIQKLSFYLTENKDRLHYEHKSVSAV